jgi:hypothetical protein
VASGEEQGATQYGDVLIHLIFDDDGGHQVLEMKEVEDIFSASDSKLGNGTGGRVIIY